MKKKTFSTYLMLAVLIVGGLVACAESPADDGTPRVVATTTLVGDLAKAIGGADIELTVLMGPGIDPHLYKPSEGDIRRMSDAKVVLYSGLHLEGKMADVFEQMGELGRPTYAVAECVPEDERLVDVTGYGTHDPHVWFDVTLWKHAAICVRDALSENFPDSADAFAERAATYVASLDELDAYVERRAAELNPDQRVLVTAHDAFSYFGERYGFEVRGLLGLSTAAEAGTSDVQELAKFIVERRVPAIFIETSVPERYVLALKQAVEARGFDVVIGGSLYSDALGDVGSPAENYVGTVRHNVDTIVGALAVEGDTQSARAFP